MQKNCSAMAVLAIIAVTAACSRGTGSASSGATSGPAAPGSAVTTTVAAVGDAQRGHTVFSANCAVCHGATGTEGGVGPSLKGERLRKNTGETIAWIKNPAPPMPKLYPKPLDDRDLRDVAAYVQSL